MKIFYHANCCDGFCAAWIARNFYINNMNLEFIPINYGTEVRLENLNEQDILILDFSFKRPVLEEIIKICKSLVLIDHHKTAQEDLKGLQLSYNNVKIIFDMTKSGARLTWEYFYSANPVPRLVSYTEDRDLWKFQLLNSKQVNEAIGSYPFDFEVWNKLNHIPLEQLTTDGVAILRYQEQKIKDAVRNAIEVNFPYSTISNNNQNQIGIKIKILNSTTLISEIVGELAKDTLFAACYFVRKDNKVQWSLRSSEHGLDVSKIAAQFGGGGHQHAAGFETDLKFLGDLLNVR